MSILSWNCRGLGHPSAIPMLSDLVRSNQPELIFLFETLSFSVTLESVRRMLRYDGCVSVDRVGRGGGVAVLWRNVLRCKVTSYSSHHLDVEVEDEVRGTWRVTGYYGYADRSLRRESWALIRRLASLSRLPWCIIGDFNDLLSPEDKRGYRDHPLYLMRGFQDAIVDAQLSEIPLTGYQFTWRFRLGTPYAIEQRLDRAFATKEWFDLFPQAKLLNLISPKSDHSPLLLQRDPSVHLPRNITFRFENAWLCEPELDGIVMEGWSSGVQGEILSHLRGCATALSTWGRSLRMRFREDIHSCKNAMEALRDRRDSVGVARYNRMNRKLSKLILQEEAFWKQRSKSYWLKDGDRNTKFFHANATCRHKKKKIDTLLRGDGSVASQPVAIRGVVGDYFHQLFASQRGEYEPVTSVLETKLNHIDNDRLVRDFDKEEFRAALMDMEDDKAPGPDGYNPAFYKRYWNSYSDVIFTSCVAWLQRGEFPHEINDTNLALIPKNDNPTSMADWHPIALCNVLYKIVSKVLANRLKLVLSKCVSVEQSAFVPNRSILDNAMIAFEAIHYLKNKRRGKKGDVALKIDMSKAYDRVDWGYIYAVLGKMGFCNQWITWMRMCIESVSFSVLVNQDRVGPIAPGRGLRQGDPLSPYLFILCSEGLTALMHKALARGDLHGLTICRGAPVISHLLFADDCFLFFRATLGETMRIRSILEVYEKASGQKINFQKSEIFFSKNVPHGNQVTLAGHLDVKLCLGTGKYLGLPSMVGRSKKSLFNFIKERVWRKINSWSGKMLTKAGKEVMIKSVLQSIPTYFMSLFLIPSTLIIEIERMLNGYWWGGGLRWMSWDKLCVAKSFGGMGFRDLKAFNLALLGKQAWRLQTQPDLLVSRLYRAKYFPHGDILHAQKKNNSSFVWNSIMESQHLLKEGAIWSIGDGSNIALFDSTWVADKSPIRPREQRLFNPLLRVDFLLVHGRKVWNDSLVRFLLDDASATAVFRTPLFSFVPTDSLGWRYERSGIYSVRSAYKLAMQTTHDNSHLQIDGMWNSLWKLQVPPKVKSFLWRLARNCLPTRATLIHRGVVVPPRCPFCNDFDETTAHLFITCSMAQNCWRSLGLAGCVSAAAAAAQSASDLFFVVFADLAGDERLAWCMTLWSIWTSRNNLVWNNARDTAAAIVLRGNRLLADWTAARSATVAAVAASRHGDGAVTPQAHVTAVEWQPPPHGFVKCNVDAAFDTDANKVGFGFCLRDDTGRFIAAKMESFYPTLDTYKGEALGLLLAIDWVRQLRYSDVIFELDAKVVVDDFNKASDIVSDYGCMLHSCREAFSFFTSNSHVEFSRRGTNMAAHTLARVALLSVSSQTVFDIPACISSIIYNEMK